MSQGGKSECRALVPVGVQETVSASANTRAAAPFVVQLAASNKGFATYRAKRRANPGDGTNSYRVSAERIVALPPLGSKLNYCA